MPIEGASGPMGFATALADELGSGLHAVLPNTGDDPVRFALGSAGEISVRNLGMLGAARGEGKAVVYDTELGASYWSARDGVVEEWLRIDRPTDGVVANYEIEGARFVATPAGVEVRDHEGQALLDVSAPMARDAEGRPVEVWLEVIDERLAVLIDAPDDATGPLMVDPVWELADEIPMGRRLHTGTRLDDGRVLVAGGIDEANVVSDSVEIFDPETGSWSSAAPLPFPARSQAQVGLQDGRVLLTHGKGPGITDGTQAFLYDVGEDSWAIADPNRTNIGGTRLGSRSVLLPDGKVLMTGSYSGPGVRAHVYDPVEDEFHAIADMSVHRLAHSLTVLPDGSVLVAGGGTLNATGLNSNTAELYVPDMESEQPYLNGEWVELDDMNAGHMDHQAVLLEHGPNAGKVLICAGLDGASNPGHYFFTSACDLYDPDTQSFELAASIPHPRQRGGNNNGGDFLAVVESGPAAGKVVFTGGWPSTGYTDIYDPATDAWTTECNLGTGRLRHHTTALLDGSVLVVGGQVHPGTQALRDTERLHLTADDDDCDGISNDTDICPEGGCGVVVGRVVTDSNEDCDPAGENGVFGVQVRASKDDETRYGFTNLEGEYLLELPNGSWDISVVDSETIEEIDDCGGPDQVQVWGGLTELPPVLLGHECTGSLAISSLDPNDEGGCNGLPYTTPCPELPWRYCFDAYNGGSAWSSGPPPGTILTVLLPEGMDYIGFTDPNGCNFSENTAQLVGDQWEVEYDLGGTPGGALCQVCVDVVAGPIPNDGWTASANLEAVCGNLKFDEQAHTSTDDECGCDPNDKLVYPAGCNDVGTISSQPLTYTVRFQNTGLGPAHTVRIIDPIDGDLELESLSLRGASHPITSVQMDPEGQLFVTFDDIELPAAVDDPVGSNGYIQFDLTPAVSSDGTQYTNLAEIYFDHNEVVITNEVVNTIGECPPVWNPGWNSRSGLGDGTNPGRGEGRENSQNGGGGNPNQAP